jgi:hypothetical protein
MLTFESNAVLWFIWRVIQTAPVFLVVLFKTAVVPGQHDAMYQSRQTTN